MSNHTPTYLALGGGHGVRAGHKVHCSCGIYTPEVATLEQAQDDYRKHLEYIERVKAHLSTATPSMKSQRDYYELRASDLTETPAQRRLWQMLADELTHRLGDRSPAWEDVPLL